MIHPDIEVINEKISLELITPYYKTKRIISQNKIHGPHGGIIPELASRQHILNIDKVIDEVIDWCGHIGLFSITNNGAGLGFQF